MLELLEPLDSRDQEVILDHKVQQDNPVSQEHKVQLDKEDPQVTRDNQVQMGNQAVKDWQVSSSIVLQDPKNMNQIKYILSQRSSLLVMDSLKYITIHKK